MLVERFKFVSPAFSEALKKIALSEQGLSVARKMGTFVEDWSKEVSNAQKLQEQFKEKLQEKDEKTMEEWKEYLMECVELPDVAESDLDGCKNLELSANDYLLLKNVFIG